MRNHSAFSPLYNQNPGGKQEKHQPESWEFGAVRFSIAAGSEDGRKNLAMKTWKKVLIGVGAVLVLGIIVAVTVYQSQKNVVTVQTGKVQKQNLASVVSASGEIKPKTYVNIGANAFGKIIKLHVKEGDHVKKGQLLAQLENVQSSADVNATRASVQAAVTDAAAQDAALKTALADLNRAKSDAAHAKLDWDRAQGLFSAALIAKQDFDVKKAAWESADWPKPKLKSPRPEPRKIRWISTSPRIRPT
jgi:multidrug efflux pump subunit AcrA (membrane-fusion protein)